MDNNCSVLKLIIGPMRSRKTTELINEISKYSYKYNYIIFNNNKDTRCEDEIKTHNNIKYNAIKINELSEIYKDKKILEKYNNSKIIGIDEAQFYPDLVNFILTELKNTTKIFIISGLDCDYKQSFWTYNNNNLQLCNGNLWGDIIKLIPHADVVKRLYSYCSKHNCYNTAPYTTRNNNNNNLLLIDDNQYINVCRYHYYNK